MERQPAVAAAEDAIALYDTCWFHRLVLHSYPPPTPLPLPMPMPPPVSEQQQQPEQAPAESKRELERAPTGLRHRRTRSDEAKTATFDALEPLKIPHSHRARLETILSGKDGLAAPQPQPLPERRRPEKRWPGGRRRKARGRSLSELEFEEVKGLQDLGFTFSEADVDAELASIVPGLRRLRADEEAKKAEAAVAAASAEEEEACRNRAASAPAPRRRRPYLSEAWEDEEAEVRRMLSTFRVPAADDGADLKEHLRLWAHSVASAVR
uniref:Uncharacterized protein n=1 Tax=Avena sativa TaxID=4498 RepID=A0ACD5WYH2_AVESA